MDCDGGRSSPMLRALTWSLVCCTIACTGRERPSETTAAAVPSETWADPENVGAPINTECNDMYAVLTRDDLVMYFTSDRPLPDRPPDSCSCTGDPSLPACDNNLWMASRDSVDSAWQPPVPLAALNSSSDDSLPMLSHSENVMWFYSRRSGGCGSGDLWQTKRQTDDSWGEPINLGLDCTVNTTNDETAPAFYANDDLGVTTLYFGSNRSGGVGDYDVYETSTQDEDLYGARWGPPAIVPNVNSAGRDTRTWIRRDGRELFITSNRAGGAGLLDIWYSTREANTDPWSTPANLGPTINTASNEGSPSLTWDGNTLYFFSTRPGGHGGRDIWLSRRLSPR